MIIIIGPCQPCTLGGPAGYRLALLFALVAATACVVPSQVPIMLSDLTISDAFLSGTLPPELGSLSGLATMDLHSNHLYGAIPPELGNVSKLRVPNLANNKSSGSLPPELGNLAELAVLALYKNKLSRMQISPAIHSMRISFSSRVFLCWAAKETATQ